MDATPPSDWIPRTDAGARKLIERLDRYERSQSEALSSVTARLSALEGGSAALRAEVTGKVSWRDIITIVGSAAVITIAGAWAFTTGRLEKSDSMQAAQLKRVEDELVRVRQENAAIVKFLIEGQPRLKVAAELKQQRALTDGGSQ